MEKTVWDDQFSVGVETIDEQHKKLFLLVNRLIDVDHINVDSEIISEILTDMTEYARYHFETEEKLMLEYNYPNYLNHKEQHLQFIEQTVDFCMKTIKHQKDVPARLFAYLNDWLVNHVLYTDKQMEPFYKRNGIN